MLPGMNVLRQTVGYILEFFIIVMAEILTCVPDVVILYLLSIFLNAHANLCSLCVRLPSLRLHNFYSVTPGSSFTSAHKTLGSSASNHFAPQAGVQIQAALMCHCWLHLSVRVWAASNNIPSFVFFWASGSSTVPCGPDTWSFHETAILCHAAFWSDDCLITQSSMLWQFVSFTDKLRILER